MSCSSPLGCCFLDNQPGIQHGKVGHDTADTPIRAILTFSHSVTQKCIGILPDPGQVSVPYFKLVALKPFELYAPVTPMTPKLIHVTPKWMGILLAARQVSVPSLNLIALKRFELCCSGPPKLTPMTPVTPTGCKEMASRTSRAWRFFRWACKFQIVKNGNKCKIG